MGRFGNPALAHLMAEGAGHAAAASFAGHEMTSGFSKTVRHWPRAAGILARLSFEETLNLVAVVNGDAGKHFGDAFQVSNFLRKENAGRLNLADGMIGGKDIAFCSRRADFALNARISEMRQVILAAKVRGGITGPKTGLRFLKLII